MSRSPRSRQKSVVRRGRPRSAEAQRAVLDAARDLVVAGGYPAATIDAIVARSGVAKTTIYRRWPNRAALIVDLLAELSAEQVPLMGGGAAPLAALRTEMRLIASLGDALIGRLITSLLAEAQYDRDVRVALVDGLFNPRRRAMAMVVRRAQDADEIRADLDPLTVVDLLVGPLFFRMFVRHERLDARFARDAFDHMMKGLMRPVRPSRGRARGRN